MTTVIVVRSPSGAPHHAALANMPPHSLSALPHGYLTRQIKVNPGGPTSNRLMALLPRRCHSSARNALPCMTDPDSVLLGNAASSKTAVKWHFLCDLPGLPSAFYALRCLRFLPPLISAVFGCAPSPHL